ncbi:hypothetical protein DVH24_019005 [Malus domestica]|uniref:Adenylyl-sulfate kinase n=1 Tax=Malus domestica TaxID=3750 RepID=A0A498I2H1_MALDO|nr:hypothetical protein DVH24_019005 [Malus domestica]
MSTLNNSTNVFWQECQVGKVDRQKLLNQKGCVVWITGLSGSGHVFLTYPMSLSLWWKLFREFLVSWVFPRNCFSFL